MKPFKKLGEDLRKMQEELKKLEKDMPRIAGNIAVQELKTNLIKGIDVNGEKFKPRADKTNTSYNKRYSGKKGSVFNSKNPILIQTGKLFNSIRFLIKNIETVFIGINLNLVPYAKAHNEGLNHLPVRQYLGGNKNIFEKINKSLKLRRKNILKKFS